MQATLARSVPLRVLPIVLALFAAATIGEVLRPAQFHGDERFYTDAARTMAREGDLFTPLRHDGEPRWNKPLLTYWAITASYAAVGGGALGSRLPAMLAGMATLLLTYSAARRATGDPWVGTAAACIFATDVLLHEVSTRATPDPFLLAATALACAGFAPLLAGRALSTKEALLGWTGAGLMVASKGGLGLLLPAYFALLCGITSGNEGRQRSLVRPVPLLVYALVSALGLAGHLRGGSTAIRGLFDDQVTNRAPGHVLDPALHALEYAAESALLFLPWLLLLMWMRKRRIHVAMEAPLVRNALGWALLLLLVLSFGHLQRNRYLVPAHPLIAIALGAALRNAPRKPLLAVTFGLLGTIAVVRGVVMPLVSPRPAVQMLSALRSEALSLELDRVEVLGMDERVAGELRLLAPLDFDIRSSESLDPASKVLVLAPPARIEALTDAGFEIRARGDGWVLAVAAQAAD